jgi:hypothetical protein
MYIECMLGMITGLAGEREISVCLLSGYDGRRLLPIPVQLGGTAPEALARSQKGKLSRIAFWHDERHMKRGSW